MRCVAPVALTVIAGLALPGLVFAQPGIANRCIVWGGVTLEDGPWSMRFAPEPLPMGPHYLHYIVQLNGDERTILTELAPKWAPGEDVNIPGNGFWGCELGNFTDPEVRPGDEVEVVLTDEAAGQQGIVEFTVPPLPNGINCDVQLGRGVVHVPPLLLRGSTLQWAQPEAVTLVYRRSADDRYPNGKPRGQYVLAQRLTGGETSWVVPDAERSAWLVVQKDTEGQIIGRSREVRRFREPDGYDSLIAVTPAGKIVTMDVGSGDVTVWDDQGERLGAFSMPEGLYARKLWTVGERVVMEGVDAGGEVHWVSCQLDGQLAGEGAGPAPGVPSGRVPCETLSPRAGIALGGGRQLLLDGLGGGLALVSGGKTERVFRGEAFGGFRRPRDLVVADDGTVYVLDGTRVCILGAGLEEEALETVRRGGEVTLWWRTGRPTPSRVTVTGQGANIEFGDGKPRTSHSVTVGELPRPGQYRVAVAHAIRFLGAEPEWQTSELLVPPIRRGQTAYLRVKVAVVIWANAVQKGAVPAGAEYPSPIPAGEIERLKDEVRRGVLFYWINSHLRFFVDVDFLVDESLHELGPGAEEERPTREGLVGLMGAQGKRFEDYDGICRIIAEQAYDQGSRRWGLTGRGGGLTTGVSRDHREPGYSWWLACPQDYPIPDSWLFVHEYGHQVDGMFDASGHPEFWSNHFAPQEGNVARFGEHFDGNAYLLRWWPEEKWFASDWGRVEFAADADGDGVPDDAPALPLDEKRLGSDPTRKDTDNDGLADRAEVMAWQGIITGLGQRWAQPIMPNPRNRDSDGDGKIDGKDPFPLYPIPEAIPYRRALRADSAPLPPNEWPVFHHFAAGGLEATTSLAWSEEYLTIGCRLSSPQPVQVQIDAENDGWFVGQDNYQLLASPPRDGKGAPEVRVHVVNAAVPGKWPFDDPTLVKAEGIRCWCSTEGGYSLLISVPRSEKTGLLLRRGEKIGLAISYGNPGDPNHMLALFEPHALAPLTLARGRGGR